MAESKPIKSSELIQKDVFQNTIDQALELEPLLKGIVENFTNLNKASAKSLKGISIVDSKSLKEANTLLAETTKNRKLAQAAETQLNTVTKARIALTDQQIKQNSVNAVTEKQRIDRLKALAITENNLIGTEQKLLAANTLLRIERQKLIASDKDYGANLNRINGQLDANNALIKNNSDAQKKQTLTIGDYKNQVKLAIAESAGLGGILGKVTSVIEVYEGALKAQKLATAASTLATTGDIAAHEANVLAIEEEALATEQLTLAKRALNAVTSPLGLILIGIAALAALATAVYDVNQGLQDTYAIGKSFAEDKFWGTGDQFQNLTKATIKLRKEIGGLQLGLQELEDNASDLTEIANDETLAIGVREKAFKDAQAARVVAANKNLEIAQREKYLTDQAVKAEASRRGVGVDNVRQEFLDKQVEASKKLFDATDRLNDLERTNAEESRKFTENKIIDEIELIRSKKLGADSDVENLKKQVDDEQTILSTRMSALRQLTATQAKAQAEETRLLTEFGLTTKEVNDLIATTDAVNLQQKLKALAVDRLSVGQQQELAKVITETQKNQLDRTAQQNKIDEQAIQNRATILKLNNEINQIELDKNAKDAENRLSDLKNTTGKEEANSLLTRNLFRKKNQQATIQAFDNEKQAQNEATQANLEAINNRYKDEIDLIRKSIADKTKEQDIGFKEIEKLQLQQVNEVEALADKEINIEANKQKYIADLRKKQLQETLNQLSKVTQAFGEELDKRNQLQNDQDNRSIDQTKNQLSRQEELARNGQANELAFQEAQLAKKEQAQRDSLERQAKEKEIIALTEAYLNAYNAELNQPNSDPNQAALLALKDVLLAKGIAKGLVQFAADGNNMIEGTGTTTSDSIPFMLSKSEAVVKAKANLKHNDAVVALNAGDFDKKYIPRMSINEESGNYIASSQNNIWASMQLQKSDEILATLKAIEAKPVHQTNIDELGNIIDRVYKKNFTETTTLKRRI